MSKFTKFCPKFTKVRTSWNLCSEVLLNHRTKYGWPKSFLSRKQRFLCLLLCLWTATQLQNSQTHCSEQLDSIVVCVQSEPHRYVFTSHLHPANSVFLLRSVWFSVLCLQNGPFLLGVASFNTKEPFCRVDSQLGGLTVGEVCQRSSAPVHTILNSLFAWTVTLLLGAVGLCFTGQTVRKSL